MIHRIPCLAAITFTLLALLSNSTMSQILIEFDLSVANEITITATDGLSPATVSGAHNVGVYFDNFFTEDGTLSETLVAGDLTTTQNDSDMSPNLFRGSGNDPGLNLWSFSIDTIVNFVTGVQAFTGSATFTVDAATFQTFLSANTTGDLYFPADTVDDLAGATLIGSYMTGTGSGPCDFDIGDINEDGAIDLLDVAPFVNAITIGMFFCEADINQDGAVDLLDVAPFVNLLAG